MGTLAGKQLEPRLIAQLAYEAGWTDAYDLVTSVSVCLAESQGYTEAHNENPDGTSDWGPWQLNDIHGQSIADRCDEARSTKFAHGLWKSRGGFQDWAAFTSGVFLHDSYIGRAAMGVGNYLADRLLGEPVGNVTEPYTHHFETPILDFRFRLDAMVKASGQARHLMLASRQNEVKAGALLADALKVTHLIHPPAG